MQSDPMNQTSPNSNPGTTNSQEANNTSRDTHFMKKAAQGGLAEVELGRLAEQKAASQDVKDFGKQMVNDHQKANEQLKAVASKQNVDLPGEVSAKQRKEIDRLSKLSGEQFDKAYMQHMLKDHKKDVAEFRKEANKGKDPDVKSFAANTLPTLEQHLQHAQSIAGRNTSGSAARMKQSPNQNTPATSNSSDQDRDRDQNK
jgi:putative membrane protein